MDLRELIVHYGELFAQKQDGSIVKFDNNTHSDLGVAFDSVIETKGFSFGEPYNPKKLKELQVVVGDQPIETNVTLEGYVDDNKVTTEALPIKSTVGLDFQENLTDIHKVVMNGKGYYSKIKITHSEDKPFYVVGIGFVFKVKKP
jgi:hypothetical protein